MMRRSNFQKVLGYLALLALVIACGFLGVWQLHRAQASNRPVIVNSEIVPLETLASPRNSLNGSVALRKVTVSGKYVVRFEAPNQIDSTGKSGTWEVDLMQVPPSAAILVVRGLWADRDPQDPTKEFTITATLMPHQNDAHAQGSAQVLARIDSALVVDKTSLDLYDGYLVVAEESAVNNGQKTLVSRIRISSPAPKSVIPGFYWQHVSYVFIWWFMGCVVLYLPFYQRKIRRITTEKESSQ
jgi:surfeit locus 1 family protein